MSKKNKVNPNKRPVNAAQAAKAADKAFYCAIAIMLQTVIDTGRYSHEEIPELWDAINYKADSISKGYCSLRDIIVQLEDEYDITVGAGTKMKFI